MTSRSRGRAPRVILQGSLRRLPPTLPQSRRGTHLAGPVSASPGFWFGSPAGQSGSPWRGSIGDKAEPTPGSLGADPRARIWAGASVRCRGPPRLLLGPAVGSSAGAACSRPPARVSGSTCSGPAAATPSPRGAASGLVAGRSELARLAVRRSRAEAGRARRQRCLSSFSLASSRFAPTTAPSGLLARTLQAPPSARLSRLWPSGRLAGADVSAIEIPQERGPGASSPAFGWRSGSQLSAPSETRGLSPAVAAYPLLNTSRLGMSETPRPRGRGYGTASRSR